MLGESKEKLDQYQQYQGIMDVSHYLQKEIEVLLIPSFVISLLLSKNGTYHKLSEPETYGAVRKRLLKIENVSLK